MMCASEDRAGPEENMESGGVSSGEFSFKTAWSNEGDLTTRDSSPGGSGRTPRDGRSFGGSYAGGPRGRGDFNRPGGPRGGFQRRPAGNGERRGGFEKPRRDFNSPRPGQAPHYRRPSGDGQRRDSNGENRRFQRRDGEFQPQRREFIPSPETDYTISFYATDEAFNPIAKRLHQSGKTYETFAIAREFLASPEHYVFVLRKNPEATSKFYYSPLDGIPFSSKDEAVGHLLRNRLEELFEVEISDGEAPAGNFPTIVLCPYTKKPIAAPNHHSYKKLLNEHYMVYIHGMPFARFCQKLETSSAPEDVKAWQEAMRQNRRFKVRRRPAGERSSHAETGGEVPGENCADPEAPESPQGEPNADAAEVAEEVLQSLLEVREYLEKHIDDYVNATECIRVPGTSLELIQDRDLRNFIRYHLGRQQRFPLETANGMRAKFKQNNLHSYKNGKNGISYVCTVPRKFRSQETHLTDKLELLLDTIEKFPLSTAGAIAQKVIGEAFDADEVANLLTWLIREGYVTEFENGTLSTHPRAFVPDQNRAAKGRVTYAPDKPQVSAGESALEEIPEDIPEE
jgi:hypothetical protein